MSLRKINLPLNCRKTDNQATIEGLHVGDVGSAQFIMTLSDGSKKITLPDEGVSAIIHGKKPDGYEIHNQCNVRNGKIYYTLTAQDTAAPGTVYYQLDVQVNDGSGEERCFSPCFRTQVSERVYEPVFRLLTDVEAPENWAEHYADYYKKEDDLYVKNDNSTYAANTFYVLVDPPVESASEFLAFWAAYNNVTALFEKRLIIDRDTENIGFDADNVHKVFINATVEGEKGVVFTAHDNTQFFIGRNGNIKKRHYTNQYESWALIAEKTANKANAINSSNSYSTVLYPTLKAVSDYVTSAISGKADTVDVTAALAGKADVSDIPTVPTNVSAFTNDAGYITQHQDLSAYALAASVTAALALKADEENAVKYKEYAQTDISNLSDNAIKDKQTIYRVYSSTYGWGLLFNVVIDSAHAQIMLTHNGQILYREKGYNETWQNKSFTNVLSGYATASALESGLAGKAAADHTHSQYLTEHQDISGKENISNKINSITDDSSAITYVDDQGVQHTKDIETIYPTYNAVKNYVGNKVGEIDEYINETIDPTLEDKADKATTLSGYGITDAYTKTEADNKYLTSHQDISGKENTSNKETAISSTTQSTDSTHYPTVGAVRNYVNAQIEAEDEYNAAHYLTSHQDISGKADKATTLAGYGITDAYTKAEADNKYLTSHQDISGKENTSNKETAISSTTQSTDSTHYPTVGAVRSFVNSAIEAEDEYNAAHYLTSHQDISGKLNVAQGVANAGKFLVVGNDGNITTLTLSAWQGGSY